MGVELVGGGGVCGIMLNQIKLSLVNIALRFCQLIFLLLLKVPFLLNTLYVYRFKLKFQNQQTRTGLVGQSSFAWSNL